MNKLITSARSPLPSSPNRGYFPPQVLDEIIHSTIIIAGSLAPAQHEPAGVLATRHEGHRGAASRVQLPGCGRHRAVPECNKGTCQQAQAEGQLTNGEPTEFRIVKDQDQNLEDYLRSLDQRYIQGASHRQCAVTVAQHHLPCRNPTPEVTCPPTKLAVRCAQESSSQVLSMDKARSCVEHVRLCAQPHARKSKSPPPPGCHEH